ncbi:DUF4266 domain-containing protein [Glaciecola siphonariae]|uniref:DUF4266 domain-containing protein n=1 Tax=Glaciecola siphonariae TaxID=521012 RepID=A0ABV9LRE5_9ALTE
MRITHLKRAAMLIAALNLGGCASTFDDSTWNIANIEPWVKPYERSNLADPIMAMGRNPIAMSYAKHVNESREGARGADGGAGGGCGCN